MIIITELIGCLINDVIIWTVLKDITKQIDENVLEKCVELEFLI